jgi:voltage-gated potassium channel
MVQPPATIAITPINRASQAFTAQATPLMHANLRRLFRRIRAEVRDALVLLRESRISLLLFVLINLGGATLFHLYYTYPGTSLRPTFSQALHATFSLIFFEQVLDYPQQWYLQPLFYLIPIAGLAVVADGFVRLGTAFFNKQARGQKWQVAMASTYNNHVIICGLGKVGYRTALELRKFGRDVVGIERNPEARFVESAQSLGIPLIIADARRSENLHKAGIERADAIIPATDDELTNLDIALDAREIKPGIKVVLRLFDPDLARRVERGFGIQTAISTSALAAPIFAAAAMRVPTQYSFYVGETLLNLSELTIAAGTPIVGWKIDRLEAEVELTVVSYQHAGEMDVHPHSHHILHAGDALLVLASVQALERLNRLNTPVKGKK